MITTRPEIEYKVYNAHAKQRAFHKACQTHEYVLFNGGRGSGKTTAGAIQAILEALQYQPGQPGVITAPDYPMLEDATMKEFFLWLPPQYIADFQRQRKILLLTNGSEIAFRSLSDPEKARGPNRAWAWMDEPRNLKTREAFDTLIAQLRPSRKCWLTTTPSGIFHWIYQAFIERPLPKSHVVTVRTAENPHLPTDYETGLRSQYTGAYAQQELDAQWVSFEGRIFDNFDPAYNVTEQAEYMPDIPVQWWVDDGYALGDGPGAPNYHPRVILLAQETASGGADIFAEYVRPLELAERSLDTVLAWPYPVAEVAYIDSSAVELKARIWERGIQTVSATHPVGEGIKNVRRLICDGQNVRLLRIHPRCTHTIRELQSYRYDDHALAAAAGEPKPLKVDDHCPDAIRYGTWHLRYGM